jgi:type 2 lantibiotic biosynthesis protein LanM
MPEPLPQKRDWYRAFNLRERVTLLRNLSSASDRKAGAFERAERRLELWRVQPPFDNPSLFAQRLASDGIDEADLQYILADPPHLIAASSAIPDWFRNINAAFSAPSATVSLPFPKPSNDGENFADLTYWVEPLLQGALSLVHRRAKELAKESPGMPIDEDRIVDILFPRLVERLVGMIGRTAVLELNVARVEGTLEGETSEERFRRFVQHLREPAKGFGTLLEYPVLARQLANCIDLWAAFTLEMLNHLRTDWRQIVAAFCPDENPGVLVELNGTGDTHNHGRCVLILKFNSGFRLVYKPRSLSLDVHFQMFLDWINEHMEGMQFRTAKVLDMGSHGWAEFVAAGTCNSETEVRRFYRRQGGYLALLYALYAADFHHENVIAASEHPILIDLEALFHPTAEDIAAAEFEDPVGNALAGSVLRIGLLPERIRGDAKRKGVDISGLGGKGGQLTPYEVPRWEKSATDEMHFVRKQVPIEASQNCPTLTRGELDPAEYEEEITTGFSDTYRFLLEHRNQLLSAEGPLAAFGDDEVRVLLRNTRTYAVLLGESFHPDMLRDAMDREQLLDRLWVAVAEEPYLARAIAAEREDLLRADIPIFSAETTSRDLLTSAHGRIANFFPKSGLELVHQQLRSLGEENLSRQLWFIRASLATLVRDADAKPDSAHFSKHVAPPEREQLISVARAIGDRLSTLALRGTRVVNWIGLIPEENGQHSVLPLGLDLYEGLPGVALYLAYLGEITKEERYRELATAACTTFVGELGKNRHSISWIGGMSGWGGIIYALSHLSVLWNEPALLARACELAEQIPPLIEQDDRFDIISGAAGCIAGLLVLNECSPSRQILSMAKRAGEHLVTHAHATQCGMEWIVPGVGPKPIAGFAHGNAGIAWALLRLHAQTGQQSFKAAALHAIEQERTLFSGKSANQSLGDWAPESVVNFGDDFPTTWCRGAAGIALARLDTLAWYDNPQVRGEIEAALETTMARGFGLNHSLCHGDMGNIELLLQNKGLPGYSHWTLLAQQAAGSVFADIHDHGLYCGTPRRIETPGLMAGLAGVGYGLLRLAEPTRVPCLLIFAPPGSGGKIRPAEPFQR